MNRVCQIAITILTACLLSAMLLFALPGQTAICATAICATAICSTASASTAGRSSSSAVGGRAVSQRRKRSRRSRPKPAPSEESQGAASGSYPVAPDKIEVIEYNSPNNSTLRRMLDMPKPPSPGNSEASSGSLRRIGVRMEESRVIEIQQALRRKGFFTREPSGIYDEATIDAMTRFQTSEKIPVTGYPTAHALNRLGLAR